MEDQGRSSLTLEAHQADHDVVRLAETFAALNLPSSRTATGSGKATVQVGLLAQY